VLMVGMHHDVRPVQRRPFGIVIKERTASRENIPGIVDVKVHQTQSHRKVDSRDCTFVGNRNELPLREDLSVIFEFVERVGILRGVHPLANLDDRMVVRGLNESDSIVGWKHVNRLSGGRLGIQSCRMNDFGPGRSFTREDHFQCN